MLTLILDITSSVICGASLENTIVDDFFYFLPLFAFSQNRLKVDVAEI